MNDDELGLIPGQRVDPAEGAVEENIRIIRGMGPVICQRIQKITTGMRVKQEVSERVIEERAVDIIDRAEDRVKKTVKPVPAADDAKTDLVGIVGAEITALLEDIAKITVRRIEIPIRHQIIADAVVNWVSAGQKSQVSRIGPGKRRPGIGKADTPFQKSSGMRGKVFIITPRFGQAIILQGIKPEDYNGTLAGERLDLEVRDQKIRRQKRAQ